MRDIDNRSFGGDSVTFWGGGVKRHQGDVTKRLLANRTNHNQNRGPPAALATYSRLLFALHLPTVFLVGQ